MFPRDNEYKSPRVYIYGKRLFPIRFSIPPTRTRDALRRSHRSGLIANRAL